MLAVLGMGIASAASYCSPCAQPITYAPTVQYVQPVSNPCGPACPPPAPAPEPIAYVPAPAPVACNPCAGTSSTFGLGRTNLPGWYSDDYDYNVSSQRDLGITYLVPTRAGLVETNRIPLTNPVDQYYGTHEELGGRVLDLTDPANRSIEDQNTRDYINDPANHIANPAAAMQSGLNTSNQNAAMNRTMKQTRFDTQNRNNDMNQANQPTMSNTQNQNYGMNQANQQSYLSIPDLNSNVNQNASQINRMDNQVNQTANRLNNQVNQTANQLNKQVGDLTTPSQTTVDSTFPKSTINN